MAQEITTGEKVIRKIIANNVGDFHVETKHNMIELSWTFVNFDMESLDDGKKMFERINAEVEKLVKVKALKDEIKDLNRKIEILERYKTYYDLAIQLKHGPVPQFMVPHTQFSKVSK